MIEKKESNRVFYIVVSVIMLLILLINIKNSKFDPCDFKVYYGATKDLLDGNNPYLHPYGLASGFYKYSPETLLFFIPISFLPFNIASLLHYFLSAVGTIGVFVFGKSLIEETLFNNKNSVSNRAMMFSFLAIGVHLFRELIIGNINMILLFLMLVSYTLFRQNRSWVAGVLYAVIFITKPYFGILIIPLIMYKKYKTIGTIILSIILLSLLLIPIVGIANMLPIHKAWLLAMEGHSHYLGSPSYVGSYLSRLLGDTVGLKLYPIVDITLVFGFTVLFYKMKSSVIPSLLWVSSSSFVALVPNLVITDTEHFLVVLPLILLSLSLLERYRLTKESVIFIILLFIYGGNSSDIIGMKASLKYDSLGLLGISNFLIIIFTLYLFIKYEIKMTKYQRNIIEQNL